MKFHIMVRQDLYLIFQNRIFILSFNTLKWPLGGEVASYFNIDRTNANKQFEFEDKISSEHSKCASADTE